MKNVEKLSDNSVMTVNLYDLLNLKVHHKNVAFFYFYIEKCVIYTKQTLSLEV